MLEPNEVIDTVANKTLAYTQANISYDDYRYELGELLDTVSQYYTHFRTGELTQEGSSLHALIHAIDELATNTV